MTDRTKTAAALRPGDVVVAYPDPDHQDRYGQPGEWTIVESDLRHERYFGGRIRVEYDGGMWALHPDQPVIVRPSRREQLIHGLRELAAFLEANPDVPLHSARLQYSVDATLRRDGRTDRRAEVERVAALLGVDPIERDHYVASRSFGPVEYLAVSCDPGPRAGMCVACQAEPVAEPGAGDYTGRLCPTCIGTPSEETTR